MWPGMLRGNISGKEKGSKKSQKSQARDSLAPTYDAGAGNESIESCVLQAGSRHERPSTGQADTRDIEGELTSMPHAPSTDGESGPDGSANNVKVLIRVRPINSREQSLEGQAVSLQQLGASSLRLTVDERSYAYKYDGVVGREGTQEELFKLVGQPVVNNVMQGYNACCFAYGQTGAGKTYTMQGSLENDSSDGRGEDRGLAPRIFQALFQAIEEKEGEQEDGVLRQYTCRCSFLQIYNEQVSDLLQSGDRPLALRYDAKTGVYVENLTEEVIVNTEDALHLMAKGAQNRKVGETNMNRASSRSHSVFTLKVQCSSQLDNGITNVRYGTLHIVDLAGSERVRLSGATGKAAVEAAEINVSLTTLGRVIQKVVEAQNTKQGGRHIPYRDSKLTFLLQDSLGGNAKTMVIANVSPSKACAHETLSTLQFAARAKCVRNRAVINVDMHGDTKAMQAEIERLQAELQHLQAGTFEPMMAERDALKRRVADAELALAELRAKLEGVSEERQQLEYQVQRLDAKLVEKDRELGHYEESMAKLVAGKDADVESAQKVHAAMLADAVHAHSQAMDARDDAHASAIAALEQAHASAVSDKVAELESAGQAREAAMRDEFEARVAALKEQHARDVAAEKEAAAAAIAAVEAAAEEARSALRHRADTLQEEVEEARGAHRSEVAALEAEAAREAEKHAGQVAALEAAAAAAADVAQQLLETELRSAAAAAASAQDAAVTAERELAQQADGEWQARVDQLELELRDAGAAADLERTKVQQLASESVAAMEAQLAAVRADTEALEARCSCLREELRAATDGAEESALQARKVSSERDAAYAEVATVQEEAAKVACELQRALADRASAEKEVAAVGAALEGMTVERDALEGRLKEAAQAAQATIAELEASLASARSAADEGVAKAAERQAEREAGHAEALAAARAACAAEVTRVRDESADAMASLQRDLEKQEAAALAAAESAREEHAAEVAAVKASAAAAAREMEEAHARQMAAANAAHAAASRDAASTAAAQVEAAEAHARDVTAQLAAVRAELEAAQSRAAEAKGTNEALQHEALSAQADFDEQLGAREAEIERLRESLERADRDINEQVARLEGERAAQEEEYQVMRGELESRLQAALAHAQQERERWEAEAAQLAADRDSQRMDYEQATELHQREAQDAMQRFEEAAAASASRAAAAEAATAAEQDRLAALRQQLATTQQELEAKSAAAAELEGAHRVILQERQAAGQEAASLTTALAEAREALASERTRGAATAERYAEVQAQMKELQSALDEHSREAARRELESDVLRQQLAAAESALEDVRGRMQALEASKAQADGMWERQFAEASQEAATREAAVAEQAETIAALERELTVTQAELDEMRASKDGMGELISRIQGMISVSRPGTAASGPPPHEDIADALMTAGAGDAVAPTKKGPRSVGTPPRELIASHRVVPQAPAHATHRSEYSSRPPAYGKPCIKIEGGDLERADQHRTENLTPNARRERRPGQL